ncbi:MAG: trypsin-like serine peptidase, partial [Wenzhouxiangella sp.]
TAVPATRGLDVETGRAQRARLFQWLIESHGSPPAATTSAPLTRQDRIDLGLEQCHECRPMQADPRKLRVGVNKSVGHKVDFSNLPVAAAARGPVVFAGGVVRMTAEGPGWIKTVSSPEANAVRLMLRDTHLPGEAAIFVYNDLGEAFGPYLGQEGESWTHTVSGEAISIVVQFFGDVDRALLARTRIEIAEIVHLGPDFRLAASLSPEPQSGNGHCSYNESCVEDASCYDFNDFSYIDDARMAAGHMLFSSGPWAFLCSGGLLADSVASQIPYFITANHCISRAREANSLETYFRYMTSSCGGTCPTRGDFPRTLGSDILSTSSSSDFTLLLLDQQPPAGSVFLGWTSSEVAFTLGHELFRISHPGGAPQAFSSHVIDTGAPICSSWPRGPWIYSDDVIGATEGGSSGSPVLNASGQVVGILSGACGFNVNEVCDSESNATVDGALAHFFDDVSEWLAPDNGDPDPGDPADPGEKGTRSLVPTNK